MNVLDNPAATGACYVISARGNKLYEAALKANKPSPSPRKGNRRINPDNRVIMDNTEILHRLDEIQAYVDVLRKLVAADESDNQVIEFKPNNLDDSPFLHNTTQATQTTQKEHTSQSTRKEQPPRFVAVRESGEILRKGDILVSFRNEDWTFQSVTHPRKVFVTAKEDPNGPNGWPNMASQEFYPNVFNLGIWDTQAQDWSFSPNWQVWAGLRSLLQEKTQAA